VQASRRHRIRHRYGVGDADPGDGQETFEVLVGAVGRGARRGRRHPQEGGSDDGCLRGAVMQARLVRRPDGGLAPWPAGGRSGRGLAYKTVLTVLGRLHAKGLVDREQAGRAHAYSPQQGPAELAAEQMNAALRRGGQGTEVLQRFVDTLDPGERAALRALLDSRD